jgi:cytochrome c2
LKGIVGSKAGEVPGFRFSRAMKGSNITWDDKTLNDFIADPQKLFREMSCHFRASLMPSGEQT